MALWSALIVTVYTLVCVYEWVGVGVCFCHSFFVPLFFFCSSVSFCCSFFTSITNLVQVQEVSVNMGTISSGGNSTKTATVTACPTGYSSMILVKTTSWCVCSASSITGTTLSLTGMNPHSGSHTCWITVYVVYYPSTWNI